MVRNVACDNYRAQLEVKTSHVAPPTSGDQTTPTQSKSDDVIRITQLEDQLERSQDQSRALERQVAQLKHSLHCLEQDSQGTQQSVGQTPQSRQDRGLTAEEVEVQQEKHEVYEQQTTSTRTLGLDWERGMMYFIPSLSSPVYLVCDALVEVLWLLCIVYVIRAQPAELPR